MREIHTTFLELIPAAAPAAAVAWGHLALGLLSPKQVTVELPEVSEALLVLTQLVLPEVVEAGELVVAVVSQ